MTARFDIAALGELLIDFTDRGLSDAGMRLFEQNPGGAPANMLAAAARCGAACGEVFAGLYLEGPFFGPEKKGAHREDCLQPVSAAFLDALDG